MDAKTRFKELVKENIKRDGIDRLMEALEVTDFYTAPASTRYHDSEPEGLVKHSLKVYDALDKLNTNMNWGVSQESITIVSLFHDFCKINFYTVEMRNAKDDKGKWVKVPYYSVDDKFPFGHGEKSVLLVLEHIKLEMDELMAIRWHMLGFEPKESYQYLNTAMSEFPLIVYLSTADVMASYIG